jgi:D-alanyl-D-alanine carboxypeptidase (penicillin-binding protein 5/6)
MWYDVAEIQKQENGAMNGQNSTKKKNAATTAALIAVVVLVMVGVFVLLYVTALAPLMQKRPAPTPQETVQEQPEPQLPTTPAVPEADKPEADAPQTETHPATEMQPVEPEQEPEPAPETKTYPHAEEDDATRTLDLEVYSEGVLLIDAQTNTVVAEKNPDARIYPASMTKVMTALVACEKIENWDDTFTMTQEIIDPLYLADASLAGFVNGEKVPMLDLVYGAILPSGAEATEALAIYVAGSEAAYAELMNEKAAELGLKDTHFVDASGLHDENHYTTLRDMAVILQAAMDNETCREVLSTTYYTCQPTEQHPEGLKIFNKFLSRVENRDRAGAEILGAKTGYTAQAMNCCASFGVSPKGRSLICVTSKAWTSDFCIDDHIALYSKYGE